MRFGFTGFALSFIFALSFSVSAQQITLTKSEEKEVLPSSITMHKIFGHDNDYFYIVKHEGNQYILEKLDHNLTRVLEEPIKLFKGFRTYDLEALVHFYNELYVIVTQRKFNETVLFYQKLDKETLLPVTELIEIATIDFVRGNWPDFHVAISKKETKLMIASRIKLPLSGAQFNEYFVFGENFDIVWNRKDSYTYKGPGPRDNSYLVDETGNVSILSLLKPESLLSLLRENRNLYTIYRYTNEGNDFFEYPVTLKENYIRGIQIIAGEKGDLICAGLWSELFRSGIKGTFFFSIGDKTGRSSEYVLNSFDEAVLAELSSVNEPMINEEEVISYVISDFELRENGKTILIAEQIFRQNYNTFNNLIVTSLESNGQVYWTRVLPKRQNFAASSLESKGLNLADYRDFIRETGTMDALNYSLCSYALMAPIDRSGIVILYNDDTRNISANGKLHSFSVPRKSYLLAIAIDEFGNITKTPLESWKKKALYPSPIRYYDTLGETIVIPAIRNRKLGYYKISADVIP